MKIESVSQTSVLYKSVILSPETRRYWDNLLSGKAESSAKDAETIEGFVINFDPLHSRIAFKVKLVQADPTPYVDLVVLEDGNQIAVAEPSFELPLEETFDFDADAYTITVE